MEDILSGMKVIVVLVVSMFAHSSAMFDMCAEMLNGFLEVGFMSES